MSITINFIEGRRQSACRNDTYSIVEGEGTKSPNVLAFVSAEDLKGKSPDQIGQVFADSVRGEKPETIQAVAIAAEKLKPRKLAL